MKSFIVLTVLFVSALAQTENCWKSTYGRGVGKPIHACADGLENDASLCYIPCKAGYKGIGPVCWASITVSYGRGVGVPLQCADDEQEQAALCYKQCGPNTDAVGPVCWGQCPQGWHVCGLLCTPTADACTDAVKKIISDVGTLVEDVAKSIIGKLDIVKILEDAKSAALDLANATCDKESDITRLFSAIQ
jgi:hypothetical protein